MLKLKKPTVPVVIFVVAIVCVIVIAFLINPKEKEPEDPTEVNLNNTFEIYMVIVPEVGIYHMAGENIDQFPLEKDPVLTLKDMAVYCRGVDEDTDSITLKEDISVIERLRQKGYIHVAAGMSPFVAVCNGERIYLGVFSSDISSWSPPKGALVYFNIRAPDQNTYEISALTDESVKVLRDERIMDVLESRKILKDFSVEETKNEKSVIPKIDFMIEQINERQLMEAEVFSFLENEPELEEMLRDYNEYTATYYEFFLERAKSTMLGVFHLESEDDVTDELDIPIEFSELIERIAHYSLYENCTQLFLDDPVLYPIIDKEAGGSAGQWPYWWHTIYLNDMPEVKEDLALYFDLEEDLVKQLKAYKKSPKA